ncbi:hypothetical protein ACPPVS_04205 [Cellulomonas sp. McL0617]|uniref:hypothetical protein n=1 Tax=Cellulomonas sp. McL0617 TaxID=3415675 RepID=UPI003CF5C040
MRSRTSGTAALVTLGAAAVLAIVIGAGCAVGTWTTTTYADNGDRCASALHFHPGSSYLIHGGEMSDAARRMISDQCDANGADAWHSGWFRLSAGLLVALAAGGSLAVAARRRPVGRMNTP